jgi:hypothetical protein
MLLKSQPLRLQQWTSTLRWPTKLDAGAQAKKKLNLWSGTFEVSGFTLLAAAEPVLIFRRTVNLAGWATLPRQRD